MDTRPRHVLGERSIHLVVAVDQAQTVGTEQANAGRLSAASNREFLQKGTLGAGFPEAGGDHSDGFCTRLNGFPHRLLNPAAGTATMLRSIFFPYDFRSGKHVIPSTPPAEGLTGTSRPAKPLATRLARISWPTFPGERKAPTGRWILESTKLRAFVLSTVRVTVESTVRMGLP